MDWTQFAIFIFANIGFTLTLWLWNRTESRNDHRALESWTKDMLKTMQSDMNAFQTAMAQETKEFHARLCIIEERNKK